jgi:hypothetical protein
MDPETVDQMRRYGKLIADAPSLGANEAWLLNFYSFAGTVDVTWLAQGAEAPITTSAPKKK